VIASLLLFCFGLTGCSGERVREAANKATVQNDLKQLILGLIKTANDNDGLMPPTEYGATDRYSDVGWRLAILRNIEASQLYNTEIAGKNPLEVSSKASLLNARPRAFAGGTLAKDPTHTPYRVFVGKGAAFEKGVKIKYPFGFPDGVSQTIFIIETADTVPWCSDQEIPFDPDKPLPKITGLFPGGFYAAFGDGSVKWIPDTTDEKTLKAMITRNGNEQITLP
jgi:hypothetical protein